MMESMGKNIRKVKQRSKRKDRIQVGESKWDGGMPTGINCEVSRE